MLIDSHCHLDRLNLDKYEHGLDDAFAAARDAGVGHFLNVSIDMENFQVIRAMAETREEISISVGVHPNETEGEEPSVERLVELAQHPKVVAIGETGLDFFRTEGDQEWQRERFRRHIAAAKRTYKPLIIHMRDATEATLGMMKEEGADQVGGVMHCFVENWEIAQRALDLNFYISFSGIVTFKSAEALRDAAKRVPLERVLVETDSPYLAPVPFRGKPNEPAYVKYVAQSIAELRGVSLAEIAQATTRNFFTLFPAAESRYRG
ncbi:MAG: TatD family hydrolase [Pseudomonadota bacterium]